MPGHWEGDTLEGKFNRSAIGTLVERSTLFVLLARINQTTVEATVEGFSRVLDRVQAQHKLSLTYDRGLEMSPHETLTRRTGIEVYFAEFHAPWQRGRNENSNGLLLQYLPKGEDLNQFFPQDLDRFAWFLNSRPSKSFGWKCPAELCLPDFDFVKYYSHCFALRG